MKMKHAVAAMALAAIVSLGGIGSAAATPKVKSQAQVLGPVVLNQDGTASVTARYICSEGFHLWVSAKQSADGRPDSRLQEEGSSQHAAGWMQRHPEPSEFSCDGKWHTGTFTIVEDYWGTGQWDALKPGQAWVQFCLIGENEFISESRWAQVR